MEGRTETATDDSRFRRVLFALPAFKAAVRGYSAPGIVRGQVAALLMTLAALTLRFWLGPLLPPGYPFLTFFPAVVITGFVWGIYPAVTAAMVSGLASWYWFVAPSGSFALDPQGAIAILFYTFIVVTDIGLLYLALHALGEQVRSREALASALQMQEIVAKEVDHRVKNLMATINGLISLLQKHATTPAELAEQLRQRIGSLSRSIGLLRGAMDGQQISCRNAVLAALEPLGLSDPKRMSLEGPDLTLSSGGLIPLNLILHELGTNAIKHGAFSSGDGRLDISWNVAASQDGKRMLHVSWREKTTTPPVPEPRRRGFGTELLNRMTKSLGGECELLFGPGGLTAQITMQCQYVIEE